MLALFSCTLFDEESMWNAQGAAFKDFSVGILRVLFLDMADFFIGMGANLKRPISCRFFRRYGFLNIKITVKKEIGKLRSSCVSLWGYFERSFWWCNLNLSLFLVI